MKQHIKTLFAPDTAGRLRLILEVDQTMLMDMSHMN